MLLTKKDIEIEIAKTKNQDAIRHSLSNYFENLEKPVAVAISINSTKGKAAALGHEDIATLANNLRKIGIDAVSYLDKESTRPDKYIITPDGIQTPILKAEDALKATLLIEDQICSQDDIKLSGHANLLNNGNLAYSAERQSKTKDRVLDIKGSHPHPENIEKILAKYGEDYDTFIDRKVTEATEKAITIDTNEMDWQNMVNGREYVWRGATFVGKPFIAVAPRNARRVSYASPSLLVSRGYTGYGYTASGTGGASFPRTKSGKNYGCLYKFKTLGDEQIYYHDTGLEAASNGQKYKKEEETLPFETGVLEHKNEVLAMYLHVGTDKYFPIPIDKHGNITDEEWKDFSALHEPSDDTVYGYMAQRLDAQKRELDANPEHCYRLELKELAPTEIEKRTFSAEEFADALAYRGNVQKDKNGHISINQDINCDVDVKNVDFASMTINGKCVLNDVGTVSVFNLPRIEETETGLSTGLIFRGKGKLTDVDKISTEDFLKITGQWKKNINYSETFLSVEPNIEIESVPKDFNNYKYSYVSLNCYVDRMENYPQTQRGCSYVKVRDQSSIENMSTDEFLSKIKGDLGKTIESGLNLSTTNIITLPKAMKHEMLDSVTMNFHETVRSLDNFPKTQKGIYGLNFEGDLSQLTTEEFLLKVKGETWCKNNLSTREDGTKVYKNFQLNASNENIMFKITKYPKDVANYEFWGAFNKNEEANAWKKEGLRQKTLAKKNDKDLVLKANEALSVGDLSDFKCESIQINGNEMDVSEIKLPAQAKQVIMSSVTKLPELPASCTDFSLYHSNIEGATIDLQSCQSLSIEDCNLTQSSIKFPEKSDVVVVKGSQFGKNQQIDLSQCEQGEISGISGGTGIKMPQAATSTNIQELPDNLIEVSTKYISSCKVTVPQGVKIVDSVMPNGKKIPLKNLKRNLSKAQINTLRKDRIIENFSGLKKLFTKNQVSKNTPHLPVHAPKQETLSIRAADKKKIEALRGYAAMPNYALSSKTEEMTEQTVKPMNNELSNDMSKSVSEVVNMSKKEKKKFFYNLRRGINTILMKEEQGITAIKGKARPQTNTQTNLNIAQMKMARDKDSLTL